MSFSVGGSNLSFVLPDGTILFRNLDFSLDVRRTGLVGRNGAGKSTLLHLLAGLLKPSSGAVVASGRLALLQQDAHGLTFDTVADALGVRELLARYRRVIDGQGSAADVAMLDGFWDLPEQIEAALSRGGLEGLDAQRAYASLSGGEQTRLRFARLLLERPNVVLLDEPTNHLDRQGRDFVYTWIEEWRGGLVVASHDPSILERMDEIAVLDASGLRRYGGNYTF